MEPVFDPAALEYEREGTRLAAAARDAYFTRPAPVVWRGPPAAPAVGRGGRALVRRRPATRRRRYERVIAEEQLPADRIDYKLQICCASAVLEEEVSDLLAEPLRPAAARLAAAARASTHKDAGRTAEILTKWGAGQTPTTLGLVTMGLLVAVRRGLRNDEATFAPLLGRLFTAEWIDALQTDAVGPVLDELRKVRNAACHPAGEFDEAAYRAFAVRLVGRGRLTDWDAVGPDPDPPPADAGFLHRLLTGSRLVPPAAPDRLLALAAPRAEGFALELTAHARQPDRSAGAEAESRFRLGAELVLKVRSARDCHLALIDLGTTGRVSLLLPNAMCPRPRLAAGVSALFPGPGFAEFAFVLEGEPGLERLVAVATSDPLPLPAPPAGGFFAPLTDADLEHVADAVTALPADRWAARACSFTLDR